MSNCWGQPLSYRQDSFAEWEDSNSSSSSSKIQNQFQFQFQKGGLWNRLSCSLFFRLKLVECGKAWIYLKWCVSLPLARSLGVSVAIISGPVPVTRPDWPEANCPHSQRRLTFEHTDIPKRTRKKQRKEKWIWPWQVQLLRKRENLQNCFTGKAIKKVDTNFGAKPASPMSDLGEHRLLLSLSLKWRKFRKESDIMGLCKCFLHLPTSMPEQKSCWSACNGATSGRKEEEEEAQPAWRRKSEAKKKLFFLPLVLYSDLFCSPKLCPPVYIHGYSAAAGSGELSRVPFDLISQDLGELPPFFGSSIATKLKSIPSALQRDSQWTTSFLLASMALPWISVFSARHVISLAWSLILGLNSMMDVVTDSPSAFIENCKSQVIV